MTTRSQIRMLSKLGHRGTLGTTLLEIAGETNSLMVLTADLATTSALTRFEKTFPDRFLNVGIAEQNMIGIAAGFAKEGFVPFATTFATFATMRAFEQIRLHLGYMNRNVKVVGMASGFSMGMFGNTHYALEDLSLMRAIPGLTVLSPSDGLEVGKCIRAATRHVGPVYLRLSGVMNTPIVNHEDYEFEIGKAITLREGGDVTIIATGTMVHVALEAAKILERKGASATVVNMHTIKPLDTSVIDKACQTTGLVVTVEEHSVIGGLAGAVAEYKSSLSGNIPKQLSIGVPDTFCRPGDYQYLLARFGLTDEAVAEKIAANLP